MDLPLPIENLPLFIPAALVLIFTPGPVVFYIMNRSINQGRKAGLVSVAGGVLGNICHVIAAAFGLSAVLLSSSLAFDVLKYLGAAYLIYLGIQELRSTHQIKEQTIQPESLQNIFIESIIVAILNPKTALFFFAFLPQFIEPSKGFVTDQVLFLGVLLVTMATIANAMFAVMGGAAGRWLRGNQRYLPKKRRKAPGLSYADFVRHGDIRRKELSSERKSAIVRGSVAGCRPTDSPTSEVRA